MKKKKKICQKKNNSYRSKSVFDKKKIMKVGQIHKK